MEQIGILTITLLIVNGLLTYKGFQDVAFFDKYAFNVHKVLVDKEYRRLVTSGFLHGNWTHYLFNMITLYLFSDSLEAFLGIPSFLLVFFGSLIGGNLVALYIHRNHPDYTAIGASGAVSGLIFASIALFPGMNIGFILLPIEIPGWLYGIVYVAVSIYGIKSQRGNIGHEAHLGGGVVGLIIAILLDPSVLTTNLFPIALILVPAIVFFYLIVKMPHLLLLSSSPFTKTTGVQSFEDKYNSEKVEKQFEIDSILDKISKKGYESLSKKDQDRLKELTK